VVSRATRRAVSSPGRGGRSQGSGSRGSESGSGGERGSAGIRWGAMVAAPLCGLLLKTQLDPNSRDWLASLLRSGHDSHSPSGAQLLLQHGVSHAACEAAATPAAEKSDDSVAQTAIELAAEQTHSVAVHDQLLNELERVRAERDALEEQRQALQSALAEHAKRPAATIVQQEIKYSETWDAKIAELLATKTSERVLELMQQPIAGGEDATPSSSLVLGIISDEGLDLSKEPGLAETASVEQAQGRLRALLLELHHRTRLEGVSVAAAIKATEETATRQHLVELSQKMSQQEAYVQSLTETKASEIREATISELRDRDAKFRAQLRLQWAKMNEESLKLGQHNIKLKQLHYSLSRDDDLERAKQDLEIFFTNEAKENSLHLLQAKDKVKNFDQTLENDASKAVHAQLIHRLGLSVQGLVTDLGTQRPLTSHLIALRKLAHADDVVAAVVCACSVSLLPRKICQKSARQRRGFRPCRVPPKVPKSRPLGTPFALFLCPGI